MSHITPRQQVIRDALWDHKPALLESQANEAADAVEAALVAYEESDEVLDRVACAIADGPPGVPTPRSLREALVPAALRILRAARGVPTEEGT